MPIIFSGGTNDREDPILLPPDTLQDSLGAEYRPGRQGVYRVKGRDKLASAAVSATGLYYAGYDDGTDWLIVQGGSQYLAGAISPSGISLSTGLDWGAAPLPVTGTHYGNRHYLVNSAQNAVVERVATGLTFRLPGMAAPTATLGTSITQGVSSFSTTTGLIYWHTEYDAVRGIESVGGATSSSTGVFSSKDGVVVTVTGASVNANSTHWRLYRTTDGGVYPDGGMLAQLGWTQTSYTDAYTNVSTLLTPSYGFLPIGELTFERDERPPILSVIGSYSGSLVGFPVGSARELRYTPAGYPESWPSVYSTPLETHRHDIGIGVAEYFGSLGVFTRDTVHRLTRLNREVDSVFAPGETIVLVTDERGAISTRGIALFSPPGSGPRIAFVARDGIWMTDLDTVVPLTDGVDWEGRVDLANLPSCVLVNDPFGRRLVFAYRMVGDEYNTGLMYLDYQGDGVRVTHGDHGPISAAAVAPFSGGLSVFTTDSRDGNGSLYVEGTQDRDDSELVDGDGSVTFRIRTAEYMPGGAQASTRLDTVSWLHSAGPNAMTHRFYYDGSEHPEMRTRVWSSRQADDIGLNRSVNSFSLELESTSTASFAVNYMDIESLGADGLGPSEGV